MKVFRLTLNKHDYDQYDSFIVLAETTPEVEKLVKEEYPEREWGDVNWKDGFEIEEIDLNSEARILLGSFNAS